MRKIECKYGIRFAILCILGMLFFYWLPFVAIAKETFFHYDNLGELFQSNTFLLAMKNMCLFSLMFVTLLLCLSFLVAISMQHLLKHNTRFTSVFFVFHLLPMVLPSSVIVNVLQILIKQYGVINGFLHAHEYETINFLNTEISFYILGLLYLWKNYGYCMVILYGGLNSISIETLEASKIDGANRWKSLIHISIPQMKEFIQFTIIIGIIGIFKMYKESYLLFGKYPHESVYMLQNYINNCIYSLNYARLAAVSVILIVFFSIVIYIIFIRKNRGESIAIHKRKIK